MRMFPQTVLLGHHRTSRRNTEGVQEQRKLCLGRIRELYVPVLTCYCIILTALHCFDCL